MRPRVSLVIPTYNEEHFIGACLDAIARQTEPIYEVIVVDNNSTDRTVEIVKQHPSVKLMHEKRQGLRYTRNTGMDAATGDIIGRIDADSLLAPNWSEKLRELFADPAVTVVTGSVFYYDQPAHQFNWHVDRFFRRLSSLGSGPLLYGSNMAVRRSVWKRIRPEICMEGEFFEDFDLSIHILKTGHSIAYDPRLVVGVASRVLEHPPRVYFRTMQQIDPTFRMHGVSSATAKKAKYIFWLAYFIGRVAKRGYDPEQQKASLKQFVRRREHQTRPTSNT